MSKIKSKHDSGIIRKFIILLTIFILCMGTCTFAFASDNEISIADIDFNKKGSVTLVLKDSDGAIVSDGTITLYQIAQLKENKTTKETNYDLIDNFINCDIEGLSDAEIAETYAFCAIENNIDGINKTISDEGTVSFNDINLGIYVVVQTVDSTGYYTMNPFLVTVPMSEDGTVIYDIDASPKMISLDAVPVESVAESDNDIKTNEKINETEDSKTEDSKTENNEIKNDEVIEPTDIIKNDEIKNDEVIKPTDVIENNKVIEPADTIDLAEREDDSIQDTEEETDNAETSDTVQTSDTGTILWIFGIMIGVGVVGIITCCSKRKTKG